MFNEDSTLNNIITHMITKMELVLKLHVYIGKQWLTQVQQKETYALWKTEQLFPFFQIGIDLVKWKNQIIRS
jgi:hypothetical protein